MLRQTTPSYQTSSLLPISSSTESTDWSSSGATTASPLSASCASGTSSSESPLDCSSITFCYSWLYHIFPYGDGGGSVPVYCECDDVGMWTVIQKRFDGSIDFGREWREYRNGFGDVCGEYWLGNEVIHQLTSKGYYKLQIIMKGSEGEPMHALYTRFRLADEANSYRLNLRGYSGNASDSMDYHKNCKFSTKDRDNGVNRTIFNNAMNYSGAWWLCEGLQSNLNGHYYQAHENPVHDGILWISYFGNISLQETTMMIKH